MKAEDISFCTNCGRPAMECRCGGPCYYCNGSGEVVNCMDDICIGRGTCMHNGNDPCPECGGTGKLTPERVETYEQLPQEVKASQ